MPDLRPPSRHAGILLFVAVCLVAANLRMTITAVGPLLDEIAADRGVSPAALGLLGSLPLITWGLVSPLAHGLSARLGMTRAVSWALVALAAGTAWRSLPGTEANLWLGTALIGVGLGFANALLPAVIKRDFPARVPLLMGVYTALLGGTGAFVFSRPFLTSGHHDLVLPLLGTLPLASAVVFDLGVYLVVFGGSMLILSMMGTVRPSWRTVAHRGTIDPAQRSALTGDMP